MSSPLRGGGSSSSRRGVNAARGRKRLRESSGQSRASGSEHSGTQAPSRDVGNQQSTTHETTATTAQDLATSIPRVTPSLQFPLDAPVQHNSQSMDLISRLQVELSEVKAERDAALLAVNTYKEKFTTMEQQFHTEKLNNKILLLKIENSEEQLKNLKQERDGLTRLNIDLKDTVGSKQNHRYRFMDRLMRTLDDKFVSLALVVDSKILRWAQAETMEVKFTVESVKQREWAGRMVKVSEYGIQQGDTSNNQSYKFIPVLVPEVISCLDVFYIRSFNSIEAVLVRLTKDVLKEEAWKSFIENQSLVTNAVSSISTDKTMISRVKQSLSDSISNKKRAVRDELFCLLKYFALKSSHDRRKDKPLFTKAEEIRKAQTKLLPLGMDGKPNLSTWRMKTIDCLTSDSSVHPILEGRDFRKDDPEEYDDGREKTEEDKIYCFTSLGILSNSIAFNIWVLFLGYNPYEDEDNVTEVSFFNIPRLDAWIATTVQLLEVNEQRGGGRQKNYNIRFAENMKLATFSLINQIYLFAKYWLPEELIVPTTVPGDDFKHHVLKGVDREGTIVLHSERNKTFYIALTSEWFHDYISKNCGVVRDCFVAMVSRNWKSIIPITMENNGILSNGLPADASGDYEYDYEDEDDEVEPPAPPPDAPEIMDDTPAREDVDPLPLPHTGHNQEN